MEHLSLRPNNGCGRPTLTCDLSPLSSGRPVNLMRPHYSVYCCIETTTICGTMTSVLRDTISFVKFLQDNLTFAASWSDLANKTD